MASSTISDLHPFFWRWDFLPDINGGVERLKFFRYEFSDLASSDQFWICSHGCCSKVCPRNTCPDCYGLDNGDSYFRFPSDVDQAVRLLISSILVLVLLPMVIEYFNDSARACSLGTVVQIKIMRGPSLVFTCLWFGFLRLSLEIYKIVSCKKKEYEDLKDFLFSFRHYFVIDENILCISMMYYLFQWIFVVLIVKKEEKLHELTCTKKWVGIGSVCDLIVMFSWILLGRVIPFDCSERIFNDVQSYAFSHELYTTRSLQTSFLLPLNKDFNKVKKSKAWPRF
jgi:hypothetical protein